MAVLRSQKVNGKNPYIDDMVSIALARMSLGEKLDLLGVAKYEEFMMTNSVLGNDYRYFIGAVGDCYFTSETGEVKHSSWSVDDMLRSGRTIGPAVRKVRKAELKDLVGFDFEIVD